MLPLPAWPKLTMVMACFLARVSRPVMRSGRRDTGTTMSSLIFFGAMLRRAGESAFRVSHNSAVSFAVVAALIFSGLGFWVFQKYKE